MQIAAGHSLASEVTLTSTNMPAHKHTHTRAYMHARNARSHACTRVRNDLNYTCHARTIKYTPICTHTHTSTGLSIQRIYAASQFSSLSHSVSRLEYLHSLFSDDR